MAKNEICALCGEEILVNGFQAVVYYVCSHVEHDGCFFDIHPHNVTFVICGVVSDVLLFK